MPPLMGHYLRPYESESCCFSLEDVPFQFCLDMQITWHQMSVRILYPSSEFEIWLSTSQRGAGWLLHKRCTTHTALNTLPRTFQQTATKRRRTSPFLTHAQSYNRRLRHSTATKFDKKKFQKFSNSHLCEGLNASRPEPTCMV